MLRISPGVAGGLAVCVAAAVATIFTVATSSGGPSAKADRLSATAPSFPSEPRVSVVEVVGVRDAAIVYRDRQGRVLFSTDPVANVTVVTKNLALPEVTVKETAQSQIERVPAEKVRGPKPAPSAPKEGCESGLSPDLSPTAPLDKGRCIVKLNSSAGFASLQ
jgi:hypothetical protein